jgi:hypothetical protein
MPAESITGDLMTKAW